jgi:ubiquinone/menaquinone biosynthesis C-methylase UbiE
MMTPTTADNQITSVAGDNQVLMKSSNLISRRSCELYWGEAWLSLWRALEARSLATELVHIHRSGNPLRLLDAGSGDGRFFDLLSYAVDLLAGQSLAASIQGVGLERGRNRSAGMRKRGSPLFPVRGDVTALPFQNQVMDVVLCNSTLEHVVDVEKAISEFSRVLRPGGYLLLTVPSVKFEQMLLRYKLWHLIKKQRAAQVARAKSERMSHLHYLHPAMWEQHLVRSSFSMVSWRPIVPSTVVAWGDVLQALRDVGIGGGHISLRRPGLRLADVPFQIMRRLCIELEVGIAHIASRYDEGEITEQNGGAYLIVAQRSYVDAAAENADTRLAAVADQYPTMTTTT